MAESEERVNILAVDDSPEKLLALSAVLSELDQNVVCASSGREALRHLLRQEFAVVLLDVNMPGLDGFETASLMRQRKSCEHVPIIFVTAYGDESHAGRGYSLGAVDYILAPLDPGVLKTKVMVFVELFRKTAEVRRQARILEQRAFQFQRLAGASMAINSAGSIDAILATAAGLARELLGAQQAVAVAAADQKWSSPRSAISLSAKAAELGERRVLRDRAALPALLSRLNGTLRLPRGPLELASAWRALMASEEAAEAGWLAAPLFSKEGRPIGLIHLLEKTDGDFGEEDEAILTQLAQMSAVAIENSINAEALESNRLKDEFLTTLSHELRTPLSAILGWTRTLRDGGPEKRAAHGLEVIERNVLTQAKLIDDLLDVSRIITGKMSLTLRPTSLGAIIQAACDTMRPAADARGIELFFERRGREREDGVIGDPDRLQQIVWNLLSNGIKFTNRGGRVAVRLERFDSQFTIRVSDTGRGIQPEFLSHVFERFRQADSSTARPQGGLGIGLAIARHLTELHGGTISAESAGEGRGATFTVQLPAVAIGLEATDTRRRGAASVPRRAHRPAPDLTGLTILVVEDEPDGRDLIEHTLRLSGAEVRSAESAAEALEELRRRIPDVLVSDIGLPYEDGYSLIGRIRTLPRGEGGGVPAIAVTAYAREEDRMRAMVAGFQSYLAKPFEPSELAAAVGALAGRKAPPPAAVVALPGDSEEAAASRVLIIEDDEDSREGLREILQFWGHAVEVAGDGTEGIEKAMKTRPGVALIDIGLPGLDGYEVAHRIREAFGEQPILLVALTGYVDSAAKKRARESGFDAHLAKPVSIDKLKPLLAGGAGMTRDSGLGTGDSKEIAGSTFL
jgi:CheY-like chemotaxis protein